MSYTYKLQIWTPCKSVPGTKKKDADHMFVDGDLTKQLHYFGLSRGPVLERSMFHPGVPNKHLFLSAIMDLFTGYISLCNLKCLK